MKLHQMVATLRVDQWIVTPPDDVVDIIFLPAANEMLQSTLPIP
jgi:hypothetical protein